MAKLATLQDARTYVGTLGCGQETHGPNIWRLTMYDTEVAKKVVDAFKKAGIYIWKPREDPLNEQGQPDNVVPRAKGKLITDAVKDYPLIGRKKVVDPKTKEDIWLYFVDIGWQYMKVSGAEQPVPQLAHSEPVVMEVEASG